MRAATLSCRTARWPVQSVRFSFPPVAARASALPWLRRFSSDFAMTHPSTIPPGQARSSREKGSARACYDPDRIFTPREVPTLHPHTACRKPRPLLARSGSFHPRIACATTEPTRVKRGRCCVLLATGTRSNVRESVRTTATGGRGTRNEGRIWCRVTTRPAAPPHPSRARPPHRPRVRRRRRLRADGHPCGVRYVESARRRVSPSRATRDVRRARRSHRIPEGRSAELDLVFSPGEGVRARSITCV